jgi:hypothetical protein
LYQKFENDKWIIDLEKAKSVNVERIKKELDSYLDIYCDDNYYYDIKLKDGKTKKVQFQANRQTVYDMSSSLLVADRLPKDGTIPYTWRSRDNSTQSFLTFSDFENFIINTGMFYNKMFGIRSFLKDSLINKSIEELESYNIQLEWSKLVK